MGYGSYRSSDWSKLKASAKITDSSSVSQIFKNRSMEERFNPKFIEMRESMDSEEHPNSTPVIIGLDTTGSMGYLSEEIAKNGLNETMLKIYATNPIEDPQLMFAAIGDVTDRAPLQVTQFESDIRIAEQLFALWMEGNGGDAPEDFELMWYFAAKHTRIDSFEKHGKKGFLFTIGDADVHEMVKGPYIEDIFKDASRNYSSKNLYDMASEKYQVFHIHLNDKGLIPANFSSIMGGRIAVLPKSSVNAIPETIITIMQLANGEDRETVLSQWSEVARPVVENAIKNMTFKSKKKGLFF
ncbi:hypothetical protein SAMN02910339_00566 [Lachnospiraceae bacterium YSD2013]|nr:hypothetical protein SAMN02910339_00566 [Lachnospiraceae bacterium YSD2013]